MEKQFTQSSSSAATAEPQSQPQHNHGQYQNAWSASKALAYKQLKKNKLKKKI